MNTTKEQRCDLEYLRAQACHDGESRHKFYIKAYDLLPALLADAERLEEVKAELAEYKAHYVTRFSLDATLHGLKSAEAERDTLCRLLDVAVEALELVQTTDRKAVAEIRVFMTNYEPDRTVMDVVDTALSTIRAELRELSND